jgi:hypothetical protein
MKIKLTADNYRKANAQPTCLLPRKYEDLHKYCLIVRDEKRIMILKQSLANQGTSINTFNEDTYDAPFILTENEREGRSIEAVKILIKVSVFTVRKDVLIKLIWNC